MRMHHPAALAFVLLFGLPVPVAAQDAAPQAAQGASFGAEQLEQLVAPIALYADPLLAHVLMASTYPLEVVAAARWCRKNPKLNGDALEKALQAETWDPSVKSLCACPDVLARMNENLDWMQDLGDAFLAQQVELMQAVQRMRRKALEAGTLESGKEQQVSEGENQVVVIEAADPEVIYVPTYYPSAVYGGWGYPSWYYPPMYAPPPAGGVWFGFTVGVVWGSAVWGDCDWSHNEIDIDIDRENTFIDRTERPEQRQQVKDRGGGGGRGTWQHDASHRKGVGYRNAATAQRFEGACPEPHVSRDQARGYGERSAPHSGERSGSFSGSRSSGLDRAGSARGAASRGSMGSRGGGRRGRR